MKLVKKPIACLLAAVQIFFGVIARGAADTVSFSDIEPNQWYYKNITEMTASGILKGYSDGTFKPQQPITAAEFVTITARRAGLAPSAGQTSHWAADRMQSALESGWYDWDELPPTGEKYNLSITRELAVKIVMKAFLPASRGDYKTESKKIKDFSSLSGRYYEPVLAAYAEGVALGNPDGTLKPKSGLTRAEACAIICRAADKAGLGVPEETPDTDRPGKPVAAISGGVSENGRLQVKGSQLCNERGEPVILRGMSTHGMQWFGQYASAGAIKTTADYGANLFRVAMYTGEGGYLSQPTTIKKKVTEAVDAAIANDMYVIIDWHILSDNNPMLHLNEAKAFFAEMSARYKDEPAVLYEICNEPNGGVTWANDVKPYAEEIVKVIRAADSNGVILIGSPTWSQDIHLAADDPVKGENLMYTLHFYAGTHGKWLRDRIDYCIDRGAAIFVSEWGTSCADGSGGVYQKEAAEWLNFLDSRGISWANWSLCDKNETSAALKSGASFSGGWTENDLSESGKFVFSRFK